MQRPTLAVLLATATVLGGCSDQAPTPTDSLRTTVDVTFSRADPKNAHTHLSGDEEVPARETRAQGQLTLQLSEDGQSIAYRLMATNIENVFMAHLHLGPAGTNGPVVAWLYPNSPPPAPIPGRHSGVLAEGEITTVVGPLGDADVAALWEEIEAGNIYANVHTNDFVGDPNTGPGDFPGGEVRGQVRTGG